MLYLADFMQKDVVCDDKSYGNDAKVLYNNLSHKCALKLDEQLLSADKILVGERVHISNAVEVCALHDNGEAAICPFGEIFAGQRVYDLNGKLLGELENAEFSPKLILRKIWVQDAEFKRGQIFSVGDAVIIRAKTPRQLVAQQTQKRRAKHNETAGSPTDGKAQGDKVPSGQGASIEIAGNTATAARDTAKRPQSEEISGQIRRRYGNFNFLLGKIVDKTIVNFQGEVMVKRGEQVTRDVLRQAKISGKLIELYLHVE